MASKSLTNIRHFSTTNRKLGLLNRFKNIFRSSSDQLSAKQVRFVGDNGSENSRTIFPNQNYVESGLGKQYSEPSNYLNQSPANRTASNREEWGVKHFEEHPTSVKSVDEQVPRYILKQKWGVNLAEQVQPVSQVTETIEASKNVVKMENPRPTSTPSVLPLELPKSPSISEQKSDPPTPSQEPLVLKPPAADEGTQKLLLNTEDTIGQVDYSDSLLTVKEENEDLKAWRNVANNTKEHVKKLQEEAAKAKEPVEEEPSDEKDSNEVDDPHPRASADWPRSRKSPADSAAKRVMTVGAEQPSAPGQTIQPDEKLTERSVIAVCHTDKKQLSSISSLLVKQFEPTVYQDPTKLVLNASKNMQPATNKAEDEIQVYEYKNLDYFPALKPHLSISIGKS